VEEGKIGSGQDSPTLLSEEKMGGGLSIIVIGGKK